MNTQGQQNKFQIDEVKDDDSEGDSENDELAGFLRQLGLQQHLAGFRAQGITKLSDLVKIESFEKLVGQEAASQLGQEVEQLRK